MFDENYDIKSKQGKFILIHGFISMVSPGEIT